MEKEFTPCLKYAALTDEKQKAFRYCQRRIHRLSYYPNSSCQECFQASREANEFLQKNSVSFILYKGGHIEEDLCAKLNYPAYNIENFTGIVKAKNHNPRDEVHNYYRQLVELSFILPPCYGTI